MTITVELAEVREGMKQKYDRGKPPMINAETFFRRFQNGENSMPELLKHAKKQPSTESQKLLELMLQHVYTPKDEGSGPADERHCTRSRRERAVRKSGDIYKSFALNRPFNLHAALESR